MTLGYLTPIAAHAGGGAEQARALVATLRQRDMRIVVIRLDRDRFLESFLGKTDESFDFIELIRDGDGRSWRTALLLRWFATAVHLLARFAHVHVAPIKDGRRGAGLELLDGGIANFLCFFVRQVRATCEIIGQVRTLRDAKK